MKFKVIFAVPTCQSFYLDYIHNCRSRVFVNLNIQWIMLLNNIYFYFGLMKVLGWEKLLYQLQTIKTPPRSVNMTQSQLLMDQQERKKHPIRHPNIQNTGRRRSLMSNILMLQTSQGWIMPQLGKRLRFTTEFEIRISRILFEACDNQFCLLRTLQKCYELVRLMDRSMLEDEAVHRHCLDQFIISE